MLMLSLLADTSQMTGLPSGKHDAVGKGCCLYKGVVQSRTATNRRPYTQEDEAYLESSLPLVVLVWVSGIEC